jgi:hypothetical protein
MPYPWRKALCERTRLSDSVFLGEMLSIICEPPILTFDMHTLTRFLSFVLFGSAFRYTVGADQSGTIGRTLGKGISSTRIAVSTNYLAVSSQTAMALPSPKSIILAYQARSRFLFWNRSSISSTQWPFQLCFLCEQSNISLEFRVSMLTACPPCSVRRLDKLLVVVKTLVGEDLHIDNVSMRGDYGV